MHNAMWFEATARLLWCCRGGERPCWHGALLDFGSTAAWFPAISQAGACRVSRQRSNGEGSIYRRGSDNLWVAALTYVDDNGKLRQRVIASGRRRSDVALVGSGAAPAGRALAEKR
jgi:hypothetical protein